MNEITVKPSRLRKLKTLTLKHGAHESPEQGLCLLEAVAWLAGESHTDKPSCVSPVLGAFGRSWNDGLRNDEERTRLLAPYALRLVGTAGTPEQEETRAWMACDWLVRVQTPAWLELAGLKEHAQLLRELAPLVSAERARAAQPQINAAWAAARDAARAAAWAAAQAAARAVVWAVAWDAARTAARAVVWAVAWDAARTAAQAAAGATTNLEPTVQSLQQSALGLFDAMIAVAPGPFEAKP